MGYYAVELQEFEEKLMANNMTFVLTETQTGFVLIERQTGWCNKLYFADSYEPVNVNTLLVSLKTSKILILYESNCVKLRYFKLP